MCKSTMRHLFCLPYYFGVAFGLTPPISRRPVLPSQYTFSWASIRVNQNRSSRLSLSTSKQNPRRQASIGSIGSSQSHVLIHNLNEQMEILNQILVYNRTASDIEENILEDHSKLLCNQVLEILETMISLYTNGQIQKDVTVTKSSIAPHANSILDKAFRLVTSEAFSSPISREKVNMGMKAMKLQLYPESVFMRTLSSPLIDNNPSIHFSELMSSMKPYNRIPRQTWVHALRALSSTDINYCPSSSIQPVKILSPAHTVQITTPANAAFRILQRLITGRGVRTSKATSKSHKPLLDERDFNMVLHAYATTPLSNHMHSAHRVMALQVRTPNAPPLSAVAYSILIKSYGRAKDVKNVETTIFHAQRNGVVPDIVMANTVLDAYVNCGLLHMAQNLLHSLSVHNTTKSGTHHKYWSQLQPNTRSYNTILKGMADVGNIDEALTFSEIMYSSGLWDDITTNTLVKAAVEAKKFEIAEDILSKRTSPQFSSRWRNHPNVEAYTTLIDGLAKAGQLEKAIKTMQIMQRTGVTPNEYTYTCIVGALARNNKLRQAKKMIDYISSGQLGSSIRTRQILTPTYNALISGLLSTNEIAEKTNLGHSSNSANVMEALSILRDMQNLNIPPNIVTVTLLIEGLGSCYPPRCNEAKELVLHLQSTMKLTQAPHYQEKKETIGMEISFSNCKIATALIRAYGRAYDIASALEIFKNIYNPDVVAMNALLDVCCRCRQINLALELFRKYSSFERWTNNDVFMTSDISGKKEKLTIIRPDVVTYTTLISAILQKKDKASIRLSSKLYNEMKQTWKIIPDLVLVDAIVSALSSYGYKSYETEEIQFVLRVLRDGDHLQWNDGNEERRKKALSSILIGCSSEIWKKDEFGYGFTNAPLETDDPLFLKKGWNKIDSGFQLWGGRNLETDDAFSKKDGSFEDSFLESKGWNKIDSTFRLL